MNRGFEIFAYVLAYALAYVWRFAVFILLTTLVLLSLVVASRAEPTAARQYRNEVIREARAVWGLNAPVAVMGGQIEQESGWRPDVCSPYACGLTQFTPSTAKWISGLYSELAGGDVFNPSWAIRALVRYDQRLYRAAASAATERDRWAFTLSAYNGGLGALQREIRLCSMKSDCDPTKWEKNVEQQNARAAWAWRENRGYPVAIFRRQLGYASWGGTVS